MPPLLSTKTAPTLIADKLFALDFPPDGDWADVSSWRVGPFYGAPPQFDLEIWSNATVNLTNAELFGGSLHPFPIADLVFTVPAHASLDLGTKTTHCDTVIEAVVPGPSAFTIAFLHGSALNAGELDVSASPALVFKFKTTVTTRANFEAAVAASGIIRVKTPGVSVTPLTTVGDDFTATALAGGGVSGELDSTAHGMVTGDGPVRVAAGTTLPGGLQAAVDYWVTKLDANKFTLATSLSGAMAGTPVALTLDGVGALTLSDTSDTSRLHWHSEGLLGKLGDGAIALTAQKAYRTRREHRPRALFYALVATLSTSDPEWVSAAVYSVQDAA